MKKRFAALFLALALCLGLAVPAFAAGEDRDPLPSLSFDLPDGCTTTEKTDIYQIRHFRAEPFDEFRDKYTYEDQPISEEITCTPLPMGTEITINGVTGISSLPGTPSADGEIYYYYWLHLSAYSDPDGDGIFEERLFCGRLSGNVDGVDMYSVVPSSEKGPFIPPRDKTLMRYYNSLLANYFGFEHHFSDDHAAFKTAASDTLYQLFGANTLFRITAQPSGAADNQEEEIGWFLIPGGSDFTDVPASEWYAAAVDWAASKDITNGTNAAQTEFSPSQNCTHAQILTFLYRAARGQGKAEAADMDEAVAWAREKGMIDNSFNGGAFCTRADAVNYIWQALGRGPGEANSFTDVPADAACASAVNWAVDRGITNGTNTAQTEFSPDKICNRGTIVTFLHRAYVPESRLPF